MQNTRMMLCPQKCLGLPSPKALQEQCLSDRSTHPSHLAFTFIFEVLALFVSGVTTIVWGSLFMSGALILAGFLVTLLGMALYGWSLSAEP